MKKLLLAFALASWFATPALAHRLDEYLQATILSIEPGVVNGTMRLVPGVAVAPAIIGSIDTNHDGVLSSEEQFHYAQGVIADLHLKEDGRDLDLHLTSRAFPSVAEMKAGTGEIQLVFTANLSSPAGQHTLVFENHHQPGMSVYLVNSLVPQDTHLHIQAQSRNQNQSSYQVTLDQSPDAPPQTFPWSSLGAAFHLGTRHIAEGTDHLLFLLTLLLPAPLLAVGGRWSQRATLRQSLTHILGIVTAFTLGHSCTLALSVFGLVHVPSRPVEVLIAVSILVSAIHVLRPLFPGREAIIAGCFGLVHGLAFAAALNELGFTGWYRLVSLLGFNLGIETMQLVVVALTLPPLLLLTRTRFYVSFRVVAALLALLASCTWTVARVLQQPNPLDAFIQRFAAHGSLLCIALWLCSAFAWLTTRHPIYPARPVPLATPTD